MGKMAGLYEQEQEQENRKRGLRELIEISESYGGYVMEMALAKAKLFIRQKGLESEYEIFCRGPIDTE